MEDTIAAISTPIGEGGIAIIRVTGPRALEVADCLFVSNAGKPSEFQSHTIRFGTISSNGDPIDRVMLSVMKAPRTYTGEDTAEINCHGGVAVARRILGVVLEHGARLAEPGEFTRMAFLNGRMDLAQAESVMDVIRAKTDRSLAVASRVLDGHLSNHVNTIRDQLIKVLAHIEAYIDFPDDDIQPKTRRDLTSALRVAREELLKLLATAKNGKVLRQGVSIAIVGRPNVGKSSIMNALLGQDRSIVTPIAGTTRDTIEETACICGIPAILIDTAGIRVPRGAAERMGVTRSRKALELSDLAMHVLDGSQRLRASDTEIVGLCRGRPTITVINKIDLPRRLKFPAADLRPNIIEASTVSGDGIETIRNLVERLSLSAGGETDQASPAINERHAAAMRHAEKSLTAAIDMMDGSEPPEIAAHEIRVSLNAIGEVTGRVTTDDILDRVFSQFCIGK